MKEAPRFTAEQRAELEAWENRALTPAEFEARVRAPWTEHEREDFTALVRWFRTRYPTAGERLRAMRHRMMQLRRRTALPDR
jgi:hypothetical protein